MFILLIGYQLGDQMYRIKLRSNLLRKFWWY